MDKDIIIPNNADIDFLEQLNRIHCSDYYNELLALSQKSSMLSLIEKDKSETILSKFIKNILDDGSLNGALPVAPMGLLLRFIASYKIKQGEISELLSYLVTSPTLNVTTTSIVTEKPIKSSNSRDGYIDVFAEGIIKYPFIDKQEEFILIIENKISAQQHDNQCRRYYDYIESCYRHVANRYYVYLDPKEQISDCEAFVNISYNDFMKYVVDPLTSQIKYLKGCVTQNYIKDLKELIDTLQHPVEFMSNQPIALSAEYRKLLSAFYKENKDLILLAAKECADDADFETIEKGYNKRTREMVKYSIKNQDGIILVEETNGANLLEELLKLYDSELNLSYDKIIAKFPKLRIVTDEHSDKTGYNDVTEIAGQRCRVNNQLTRKDAKGRLDKIREIAETDGFIICKK